MTIVSNVSSPRVAHATWARDHAVHFRRLAGGAIPISVAQHLEQLAARYERFATALEEGVADGACDHAADAAD